MQPSRMPRGRTLTRQWKKVEVMKRKTGNVRTGMTMGTGVDVLPNGQEHNVFLAVDFDVASVEGEGQLQAYIQVQQVPNDTDPLMWWKQHQQEFPDLARMARVAVPATSASPERFFSRVGLVQTDLRGILLDTTMIDLMWAKQAP